MTERLITLGQIIAAVEAATGVSRVQMLSERRLPAFVEARWTVYWLAARMTLLSMPAIGQAMNRNHSSIAYGIAAVDAERAANLEFRAATDATLAVLQLAERKGNIRLAEAADPLAAAVRILRAPEREAVRVSTSEIIAMAQLVIELTEPTDPSDTVEEIDHAA